MRSSSKSKITVASPSSTANLGPGFDVLGLGIDAFYDKVTLERKPAQNKRKRIEIVRTSTSSNLSTTPEKNSAGLVVKKMMDEFAIESKVRITIAKQVPVGYGLGSSAASASAAAVAFDKLFRLKLASNKLVEFAGYGEAASAGSPHYDNVAASVLGGFVIVKTHPFLDIVRISHPKDLRLCIAIPKMKTPKKKTEFSRSLLPKKINISDVTKNISNAASMAAGFCRHDLELISKSVNDSIAEPRRKKMIPGYDKIKDKVLGTGALGFTISGAGPSVIAFASKSNNIKAISSSMSQGFKEAGLDSEVIMCRPSTGSKVVKS